MQEFHGSSESLTAEDGGGVGYWYRHGPEARLGSRDLAAAETIPS
jgi:hypothetical protein